MKQVNIYPDYYNEFHCIADKCPDNCCEEWEIVVDDDSAAIYETIDGDIGEKLRAAMTIDDDGDRIFRLDNKRCSFLDSSGLCEIHGILGEGYLCNTCSEYPRAVQDCGDFAEHDLSLSCPEAARIILSKSENPDYIEIKNEIYDYDDISYDNELMEFMKFSRKEMMNIIWDKSVSAEKAVEKCCKYALCIQKSIDDNKLEFMPYSNGITKPSDVSFRSFSYKSIIEEYLEGDILTDEFREMLEEALVLGEKPIDSPEFAEAKNAVDSFDSVYRQLCTHYINRYWLRAAFDGEAAYKIITMVKAFAIVRRFCFAYYEKNKELSFSAVVRIVQLYSKETEHNTDNM